MQAKIYCALILLSGLSGCSTAPEDPEVTMDRIYKLRVQAVDVLDGINDEKDIQPAAEKVDAIIAEIRKLSDPLKAGRSEQSMMLITRKWVEKNVAELQKHDQRKKAIVSRLSSMAKGTSLESVLDYPL